MRTILKIIVFSSILCGMAASRVSESWAAVTLEQIQVDSPTEISLVFSGNIEKGQIKKEVSADAVQLILDDVTLYSSKIIQVDGEIISKIFAYQFSPKQVKIRFSVKGKAEDLRNRFQFTALDHAIRVHLQPPRRESSQFDEEAVLNQPIGSEREQQVLSPSSHSQEGGGLGGAKSLPPVGPTILKIALVLLVLGVAALGAQRVQSFKLKGLKSKDGKKSKKPVEILSSHYLGPKKNLTLVRISGKTLVLGVTDESIRLITELEDTFHKNHEEDGVASDFADLFSSERTKPLLSTDFKASRPGASNLAVPGVLSRIRSRLEDLKPL